MLKALMRGAPYGASPTQLANRRRLLVFAPVFLAVLAIGLAYTFLRPPEYRASARVQIVPGAPGAPASQGVAPGAEAAKPFLFEVEALTSTAVFEQTAERLRRMGWDLALLGPEPISAMKSAVQVVPVGGTNVVEVAATLTRQPLVAPLVNTLLDAYTERAAEAHRAGAGGARANADEEVRRLEAEVAAKRRVAERFRAQHDIVSLEREENQVLARARGQGAALNAANERVATAEGKLRSLQASAQSGKSVVRSRDNPTLANLEQRASQLREELRELERTFTADYLALDPKVQGMRTRLAELEQQVKAQTAASQQAALAEAEEEVAAARQAARRIGEQIETDRRELGQFTARFNEYKALQEELAQLESVYRDAVQRRATLAATESARMPAVQVLEPAVTPRAPWRPLYARDAALTVGGALVLALLAMWLVELFNRPEPQPSVLIAQPVMPGFALQPPEPRLLPPMPPAAPALPAAELARLIEAATPPRELGQAEVAALLGAADPVARLAAVLLLSGLTPEEALAIERSDVDLARRVIRVPGAAGREIELSEDVARWLPTGPARAGTRLVPLPSGAGAGAGEGEGAGESADALAALRAAILCAAHDASVERPADVTPECLRHTYVAFLVRQGLRFADLTRIVGPLPAAALAEYSALAPAGSRAGLEAVDRVFPALRVGAGPAPDRGRSVG